jgi:hypothetical protein
MKRIDETYEKLLLREDGRLDTPAGFYHQIWVPPDVERVSFPSYADYEHYAGLPAVEFPVIRQHCWDAETAPDAPCVRAATVRSLLGEGEAWKRWQLKTDTTELLNDFLKLAHEDTTEKRVLKFAERWGPLWRCRQQICAGDFPPCYVYMDNTEYCFWSPYEPIDEYRMEATRAKNVLDVYTRLRDEYCNGPVSDALWEAIHHIEVSELRAEWEAALAAEWNAK